MEKSKKWTKQEEFREALVRALWQAGGGVQVHRKRSVGQVNCEADLVPVHRHSWIRMSYRSKCKCCQGVRFGDQPPQKRVPLSEIARNLGRITARRTSIIGCQQCNVHLCVKGPCFDRYHGRELT